MQHVSVAVVVTATDGTTLLSLTESDTVMPERPDDDAADEGEVLKARVRSMTAALEQRALERIDELVKMAKS